MYVKRQLDLLKILRKKSYFLFGPRQTGKTSLIQHTLNEYRYYNLLQTDVYLKLSRAPQRLRQEITDDDKIVIIDEIQKLPILLDGYQLKAGHFLPFWLYCRVMREISYQALVIPAKAGIHSPIKSRTSISDYFSASGFPPSRE
jgi:AAA domain